MDKYISLAKLYDGFSFDADSKDWADYIVALLKQKNIEQGANILDVGCGTGKTTLQLYKAGYNLIALDSSPNMLEVAAQRFADAGAKVQIINQDMREINLHRKVDAVVCINDGINYLTECQDVLKAFDAIYSVLIDGGVFLFDISSAHKLKSMHGKSYFEEDDDGLYIWHNEYSNESDILTMDLSLYSHLEDNLYEKSLETHRQKAHEEKELTKLLEQSGFVDIKTYDCFSLNSPKPKSNRIQFSAVKKQT